MAKYDFAGKPVWGVMAVGGALPGADSTADVAEWVAPCDFELEEVQASLRKIGVTNTTGSKTKIQLMIGTTDVFTSTNILSIDGNSTGTTADSANQASDNMAATSVSDGDILTIRLDDVCGEGGTTAADLVVTFCGIGV